MTDVVSSFLKSPLGILTHRLATTSYDIPHCLSNRQEGGRPSGINIRKGKSAVLRSSQWSPDLSCSRSPFPVPGRAVQTLERNETVFWSVSFPYFFPIPCMYHKRGGEEEIRKLTLLDLFLSIRPSFLLLPHFPAFSIPLATILLSNLCYLAWLRHYLKCEQHFC